LRRVQPDKGGDIGWALSTLRELSNADKHRLLAPMTAMSPLRGPVFDPPDAVLSVEVTQLGWVRVEDGAEVMRFRNLVLQPGTTDVKVDLTQAFTIVFGD